jgi:nitrogen fixation protein NifB
MIRGINDAHIPTVVEKMKRLGVRITNIMPLIPAPGSNFAHFPQTSQVEVNELRNRCAKIVPQMRHCQQCRADAVGRLGEDRSQEFRRCNYKNTLQPATASDSAVVADSTGTVATTAVPVTFTDKDAISAISGTAHAKAARYRIAVTSRSGRLVDQHFGHATVFRIYQMEGQNFSLLEERNAAQYCQGTENCYAQTDMRERIIKILQDCDGVLTMRAGHHAKESLAKYDILPVESCDSIENGLRYAAQLLTAAKN